MDPSWLFELSARRYPELGEFVRRELDSLLRSRDTANAASQGPRDCLFGTIEAYISLVLSLLPRLADRLVKGSLITDYIDNQVAEVEAATDFSDLTPITHLSEKERRLRLLVERLQHLVEEFNKTVTIPSGPGGIGSQSLALPLPSTNYSTFPPSSTFSLTTASPPVVRPLTTQPYLPPSVPVRPGMSHEAFNTPAGAAYDEYIPVAPPRRVPEFPDMVPEQPPIPKELVDASQLAQRGKGRHTCPHAFQCTKGGVNADGTLVIFERNSNFRTHLQKHERPFKCDLPGCTNRVGFARIDQLNRHKAWTRHG